jgi:hypothetical protein
VNKVRYAWNEENYEDDEKEMGVICFTRRFCRTRVPKGFKLPHDQQKYDGSQEPRLWLSDYLQAVQILGGTRAIAIQSLQLNLTGAARSWLSTLPNDSIGSWGELENQFARNFCSTYKRPASIEEVKSCMQRRGETLRSYIQQWSIIKKLHRRCLRRVGSRCLFGWPSPFGSRGRVRRTKPKTVSELIEIASRFADGEDTYNNKRARSPEGYGASRQRRMSRNEDGRRRRNQVAIGYERGDEEGNKSIEYQDKNNCR